MTRSARLFSSDGGDDGSLQAVGNGHVVAYVSGPNIKQVQGAPYSCPPVASLQLVSPSLQARTIRQEGSCLLQTQLFQGDQVVGCIRDLADSQLSLFARQFELKVPLEFELKTAKAHPIGRRYEGAVQEALLIVLKAYTHLFGRFAVGQSITHQIVLIGEGSLVSTSPSPSPNWRLRVGPGTSTLLMVGTGNLAQNVETVEQAIAIGFDAMWNRTLEHWRSIRLRDTASHSRVDGQHVQDALDVADDMKACLLAQQGADGGILAGHLYPLAYIRDQYGDFRGLLSLGLHQQARRVLEYYAGIFSRYGRLATAQGIGVEGIFHVHENDLVEITGYLVIQAFDYARVSGDEDFLRSLLPMLRWAMDCQLSQLRNGMLPFNGDETYIAGGILPRTILLHGSAEATMLFAAGASRLIEWGRRTGLVPAAELDRYEAALAQVRERFLANFWHDGRLWANNPDYLPREQWPRFRFGVCTGRLTNCLVIDWLELAKDGRYLCPPCLVQGTHQPVTQERFFLPSIALTSLYVRSGLLDEGAIRSMLGELLSDYDRTGRFSQTTANDLVPGYEVGFVLYALAALKHPRTADLLAKALSLRDQAGLWSEYFKPDGSHVGCRCRPWESGTNTEAILLAVTGHDVVNPQ